MQIIVQELRDILQDFAPRMVSISAPEFYAKPNPGKWSKIEVVGHLIDSAQNNLRRFVCGQYESAPPLIIYDQDFWVSANNYQNANQPGIVQLWQLLNESICTILETILLENYTKECNTGKATPKLYTLEWLAGDYVRHLKHHLNQIIPGSFDIIYP